MFPSSADVIIQNRPISQSERSVQLRKYNSLMGDGDALVIGDQNATLGYC